MRNPRSSNKFCKSIKKSQSKINRTPLNHQTLNHLPPTSKPSKITLSRENQTEVKNITTLNHLNIIQNHRVTIATCPTNLKSIPSRKSSILTIQSLKYPKKMPWKSKKNASRREEEQKKPNRHSKRKKNQRKRWERPQAKRWNKISKSNWTTQARKRWTRKDKMTMKTMNLAKIGDLNVHKMMTTFDSLEK